MTDFSTPSRMSAGAFIIIFLKSFREFAGATLFAVAYLLYDSHDSMGELVMKASAIFCTLLALALLVAFMGYYFKKFHIDGDKLVFTSGFAARQTTSIPLRRVHSLRTKRGLFYRLLGMRGITFDTLASYKQEVELILDESDWQALLDRVRRGEDHEGEEAEAATVPPPFEGNVRRISNSDLITGALCQNQLKGFSILSAAMLFAFDKINQLCDTSSIIDYIDSGITGSLPSGWQWVIILTALYLLIMILWTGKSVLRYGDMSIRISDKRLTITSGLLSRFTCRFARDKVTILSIKRNPLERLTKSQTVSLHQAQYASDTNKDSDIRIYGTRLGGELLSWWLGDSRNDDGPTLLSSKSGTGLFIRKFVLHLFIAIAAALILICCSHISLPAVLSICAAYTAAAALRAAMAWKHSRIELKDAYLRIDCGNIAEIREFIRYRDVESAGIRSTPFTPYTRRVSLTIMTNADSITVRSLNIRDACALRNLILDKAEDSISKKN